MHLRWPSNLRGQSASEAHALRVTGDLEIRLEVYYALMFIVLLLNFHKL